MNKDIDVRITKLLELLPRAGDIFLKYLAGEDAEVREKSKNDLVTIADEEIELYLSEEIIQKFPDDAIIREEFDNLEGTGEFSWVIDPIDGSNNYARKISDARISVALMKGDEIVYGLLFNPTTSDLYYARLGAGAKKRNLKTGKITSINVSARTADESLVIFTAGLANGDKQNLEILQNITGKIFGLRIYGSAAVAFEMIADGRADCFICNIAKNVDMAAGFLIIREAGGKVNNFIGEDWSLEDKDILVTNTANTEVFLGYVKTA